MDSTLLFMAGVAVGWFIELMIDYGYWRYRSTCTDTEVELQAEVERLSTANAMLTSQLDAWADDRERVSALERSLQAKDAALVKLLARSPSANGDPEPGCQTQPMHGSAAIGHADAPDNLMRISGIGPKVQKLLQDHGIRTFGQLAAASAWELNAVLQKAAARLPLSRHELYLTWVEQARLADAGDHQRFKVVHDQIRQRIGYHPLQRIWRIGPRTARRLRHHGVTTFEQLAAIDITQLDRSLVKSGLDYGLPSAKLHTIWTEQARLASAGGWVEFEAMEDILRAEYPDGGDDLQQIWGIDAHIRDKLHENGIIRFAQLAATSADRLQTCLADADVDLLLPRQEVYTIWIEQAQLAADGEWDELEAAQSLFDYV